VARRDQSGASAFPSLAAYEQYRGLFGVYPDFVAADRIRDDSGCVLRYDRTFTYASVLKQAGNPPPRRDAAPRRRPGDEPDRFEGCHAAIARVSPPSTANLSFLLLPKLALALLSAVQAADEYLGSLRSVLVTDCAP
jgi:hypothetical protein